ncbi:MAG: tyrosine-type recombinase/integrase [Anaerolineales bacterium]|nr:tyrosine-type recombinase/integrase [Anaerolineales bacterium]
MVSLIHPELYTSLSQWPRGNVGFYMRFRRWLRKGGYGEAALNLYGVAARLALSQIDKPYWLIDPESDLAFVTTVIEQNYASVDTRAGYRKGLLKLAEFLCYTNRQPAPDKQINWAYYLAGMPEWLAADLRGYIMHCSRNWQAADPFENMQSTAGRLTRFPRWAVAHTTLANAADLTPQVWYAYVDERFKTGIKPATLNGDLSAMQFFLRYLTQDGRIICDRFLLIERLREGPRLPKDVPPEQLRRLFAVIETEAAADHASRRRAGMMDRAWFLLMLHSGLRTGEVRRLLQTDLDLANKRARIVQAKGAKDRIVFLSAATVIAHEAYLPLRGPLATDHLFVSYHKPLSRTYCASRLRSYARKYGVKVTPHQLRHSCATLLLNAGAPILTVQTLLGHKQIDTTLHYARLYDGTVATDYYRAMATVEQQLTPMPEQKPANTGQLVALVDALQAGTLNARQRELLHTLRTGLLNISAKS